VSGSGVQQGAIQRNPVSGSTCTGSSCSASPHDTHSHRPIAETSSTSPPWRSITASASGFPGAQPHTSGNFAAELRPWRRLGSSSPGCGPAARRRSAYCRSVAALRPAAHRQQPGFGRPPGDELHQEQVDVLFDSLPLHPAGGYRYVWAMHHPAGAVTSKLRTNRPARGTWLAGLTYGAREAPDRPGYEGSPGDRSYFRTSLNDYQRARIQAATRRWPRCSSRPFRRPEEREPGARRQLDYLSRDNTLSATGPQRRVSG